MAPSLILDVIILFAVKGWYSWIIYVLRWEVGFQSRLLLFLKIFFDIIGVDICIKFLEALFFIWVANTYWIWNISSLYLCLYILWWDQVQWIIANMFWRKVRGWMMQVRYVAFKFQRIQLKFFSHSKGRWYYLNRESYIIIHA